jgi:hypothetical protein
MTQRRPALVVTTVQGPNPAMAALAAGARANGWDFIVVGDETTPAGYACEGARYYSLEEQRALDFRFAGLCPARRYARKCIGYLAAMRAGAPFLCETDDDNIPRPEFFAAPAPEIDVPVARDAGWVNVYRYFSDRLCWPRGFPLTRVRDPQTPYAGLKSERRFCPIQQALADGDPDVDAIYRLTLPLPLEFRSDRSVALAGASRCPFNSQNTRWWPAAYPLMYLPSYCSFRMTDIWRSFVAQRIAQANEWSVLFRGPTVVQERNRHDLLADFRDEIPGYLNNERLVDALAALDLAPGARNLAPNTNLRGW